MSTEEIARSLARQLDGQYDDATDCYVGAYAAEGVVHLTLTASDQLEKGHYVLAVAEAAA